MAESKIHDVNLRIFNEITCRLNESASHLNNEFLPYNKSILTRIVYDQIKKNNVLVIVHLSKKALNKYLKQNMQTSGPARGMFNSIIKLGLTKYSRMVKGKVSPQQALKTLEKYFKHELQSIYQEIGQFRQGKRSL